MSLRGPSAERGTVLHVLVEETKSSSTSKWRISVAGSNEFEHAPARAFDILRSMKNYRLVEGEFSRTEVVHPDGQRIKQIIFSLESEKGSRSDIINSLMKEFFGINTPIKEHVKGFKIKRKNDLVLLEIYTSKHPHMGEFPRVSRAKTIFNSRRVIYVFNSLEEAVKKMGEILRKRVKW